MPNNSIQKRVSTKYCPRFGQTAVSMGFITLYQLKAAITCQIEEEFAGNHRYLGTILFDKGWMTSEQIECVLNKLLKQMREEQETLGTNPGPAVVIKAI